MAQKMKCLGIVLVGLSFLLWIVIPFIPLLPVDLKAKGMILGIDLVAAEIFFWSGGAILGKELAAKYNIFHRLKQYFKSKTIK